MAMDKVFSIPLNILGLSGVVPLTDVENERKGRKKVSGVFNMLSKVFLFVLITNAFIFSGFRIAIVVEKGLSSLDTSSVNVDISKTEPLLDALVEGTDFFSTIRGPLAVLIFLLRAKQCKKFVRNIDAVTKFVYHDFPAEYSSQLRKWTRWTVIATVTAVTVHLTWEALSWTLTYPPQTPLEINSTSDSHATQAIGLNIKVYMNIIWWLLTATPSFLLSQIIYVVMMVSGQIVNDSMSLQIAAVKREIWSVEMTGKKDDGLNINGSSRLSRVERSLLAYRDLREVTESASQIFGSTLCVMYIMDILTAVGYICSFLTIDVDQGSFYIFYLAVDLLGLILYSIYTSCFILSWIAVGSKSEEFHICISHLANALARSSARRLASFGHSTTTFTTMECLQVDSSIRDILAVFQAGSARLKMDFGGVLCVSRAQVLTTFTGLASLALVANDLIRRHDKQDDYIARPHLSG